MPILPPQHDIFPADLLDGPPPADAEAAGRVAFDILSRREKNLLR